MSDAVSRITPAEALLSGVFADPPPGFLTLKVRNQTIGAIGPDWIPYLDPLLFRIVEDSATAERWITLLGGDRRSAEGLLPVAEMNHRLARWAAQLQAGGRLPGWRDELIHIYGSDESEPMMSIERSLLRPLGLLLRTVQINVHTRQDGQDRIWVSERADSKPVDPGCLDTLVGGGIVGSETPLETLTRECAEEAGIERALARRARPVGAIDSIALVRDGFATVLHRERLMLYDLKVPADFEPVFQDGEIKAAWALPLPAVIDSMATRPWTREGAWATRDLIRRLDAAPRPSSRG